MNVLMKTMYLMNLDHVLITPLLGQWAWCNNGQSANSWYGNPGPYGGGCCYQGNDYSRCYCQSQGYDCTSQYCSDGKR